MAALKALMTIVLIAMAALSDEDRPLHATVVFEDTNIDGMTLLKSDRRHLQDETIFNIDIMFDGNISSSLQAGFITARNRWMEIVKGDIASTVCMPAGSNLCGRRISQRICVDDILIFAKVSPIDGRGKILGQAGPCGTYHGRIRFGEMQFDVADADALLSQGSWPATILHEMGHILGIGTLWDSKRLISKRRAKNVYYFGKNGNKGLKQIWGGKRIVVENTGGPGTARGHWKEAVYDNELMTGYIESAGVPMPISLFTVKSLQDLGYKVDQSKADPFPKRRIGRRLRQTKPKFHMKSDIMHHKLVELEIAFPKPGKEEQFKKEEQEWLERKTNENESTSQEYEDEDDD